MSDKKIFGRTATIILFVIAVISLLPIVMLLVTSVSDEEMIMSQGYTFFPAKLSLDSYIYMFHQGSVIFRAYGITILVTAVGTALSVLFTAMLAYPMSRENFKYKNALAFFVFFTMLFHGGVVPSYIMWSSYMHVKDTIWGLIFPNYLVTTMNVLLVRNYYTSNIPVSLIESSQIDGAREGTVFFRIVFPLAKPSIATISLFTGLTYWNDWINGMYFINDSRMFGIQNYLIHIMNNIQALKSAAAAMMGAAGVKLPSFSVRMAIAVIAVLPIIVIYPFVQKYLLRGVVMGAVKG